MIHTQIALVEIHTAVRCATRTTLAAIFSQARLCFSPSLHLCPVFRQSPFGDVSTSRLWALSIRSVSLVPFVMQPRTPKQLLPRPREPMQRQLIFATMRLKRSTPKRRNAQSFVEIFLIQMGRSSSTARDANRTTPTRDGQIIAQNNTPSIPK